MDKSLLDTLSEFLPNEVLDEIANAHGFVSNNSTKTKSPKPTEELAEELTENTELEEPTEELTENTELEEPTEELTEDAELEESTEDSEQEQSIEGKLNNIFDFINADFEDAKSLNLFNTTKENYYGICNEEEILDLNYFVFPISISKLDKVLELYKEIDDVFKGTDSNKWIPNFLLENDLKGDFVKNNSKTIDYLFYLLILFLNNNGKQLQKSTTIYNNLKLERISPDLISNSDFYRKFLQKDKSEIDIFINTLNNPKVRFLKYYLLNLYNSSRDTRLKNKLYFILNTYLKGIKPCNKNINLNQYNDLRTILAIIKRITEGEINIKKQLIDKINDLYEYWLFKTLIIYFNTGGLKLTNEIKEKIDEKIYKTIHIDNLKSIYDFSNQKSGKLGEDIYLFESIIYFKDISILFKMIFFKILDCEIIFNLIKSGDIHLNIVTKEEIVTFLINNGLTEDNSKKYSGICFSKKDKLLKILNVKINEFIIGKSFIKEDFNGVSNYTEIDELSKGNLATLPLSNIERTGYKILLSLGGNTGILGDENNNHINTELKNKIIDSIPHFEEVCKDGILTPDYILKIEKDDKLCGSIIMDAKFSKYPFFDNVNKEIDYSTVLKYYSELSKNFSTTDIGNNFPFKVIILFPGDKKYGGILQQLNNYFQRNTNIVAVPLMVGDENYLLDNLKYLKEYINKFIDELILNNELKYNNN